MNHRVTAKTTPSTAPVEPQVSLLTTTDGDPHLGWLLGHVIDPNDGTRKTEALEIKWGIHPAVQ